MDKLDKMLVHSGLPTVTVLIATYGRDVVCDRQYLGSYTAQRVTSPFSVSSAVHRVVGIVSREHTLAEMRMKQHINI